MVSNRDIIKSKDKWRLDITYNKDTSLQYLSFNREKGCDGGNSNSHIFFSVFIDAKP